MTYRRYSVYWAPAPGPLSDFAAAWLGWDPVTARQVDHPDIAGLPTPAEELTREPRKYGFHGTLKAPFRLAEGTDAGALVDGIRALAAEIAPVTLPGMALSRQSGFVALRPVGDTVALGDLAATLVARLDSFRAPLTGQEIARRRPDRLDLRRRANLDRWGYPHVMEDFHFHLTLSGRLEEAAADRLIVALEPHVAPIVPQPFPVDRICLFGERPDGRFECVESFALTG